MSKKTKKVEPTTLIYCGPSLRNGELQQYSVFRGELPEHVKKHEQENFAVKELFVSTGDFGRTRRQIKIAGTRENQLYLKALEYARGGNN